MAAASPLQALLTDEALLPILWPHLTPCCRAEVFFTCRAARAAALSTATRFVAEAQSQQELNQLWALLVAASQPAPGGQPQTWMQQILHAPNIKVRLDLLPSEDEDCILGDCLAQRSDWGNSIPVIDEVFAMGTSVPRSAAELAFVARHLPGLRVLKLCADGSQYFSVLPHPACMPHLTQLVMYTAGNYISHDSIVFYGSVTQYLSQLTHLELPGHRQQSSFDIAAQVFSSAGPAPAAPNLHTLSIHQPLSDDLLQLLNFHAPALTSLTLQALPTAPLTQPCTLNKLTYHRMVSLRQLTYLPATISELRFEGVFHVDTKVNNAEEAQATLDALRRVTWAISPPPGEQQEGDPLYQHMLIVCRDSDTQADLSEEKQLVLQLEVVKQVLGMIPLEDSQVVIKVEEWTGSEKIVETLVANLPLAYDVIDYKLQWQPAGSDDLYVPLMKCIPDTCRYFGFDAGLPRNSSGAQTERMSAAQVDELKHAAPRDRPEERSIMVAIANSPILIGTIGYEFEGTLTFWYRV